ncbi:Tim44 domain-containing protein [Limnobacter litoralis]|uniref:Transporter n=1 Tax=Limnobacter litoralis TaxID=481366 RepID=A0ABQ5YQQ1_9BURK|nr:TIM44-like domain-containing protein [Limnobacter litoralis]GLR26843.1 transporter [Limnobacter litoralis]
MGRRQVWLSVMLAVFLLGSAADQVALAKRLGGGSSIGRTAPSYSKRVAPAPSGSTAPSNSTSTAPKTAPQPSTPAPAQPARSRFLGPLAGIAAGIGLAALFSHLGFGAGLSSVLSTLLMVVLAVWLFSLLVRRVMGNSLQQPGLRPASQGQNSSPMNSSTNTQFGSAFNAPTFEPAAPEPEPEGGLVKSLPAGFDESAFIAQVKKFYITMQALFDRADMVELHKYCTDDVLRALEQEIKAQRPAGGQQTDVVTLNAELIGFELDVDEEIATVHFSGHVREEAGEPAEQFEELWTLVRPVAPAAGAGWLLAGVHSL